MSSNPDCILASIGGSNLIFPLFFAWIIKLMAHTIGVQEVSSFGIVLSRFRNLAAYNEKNNILVLTST